MMLCIDVGNSHIYGGVFENDNILVRFRLSSKMTTSDELGIFLKTVLRENDYNPDLINQISICSVVPQLDYSLRSACLKYFSIEPFFLQSGVKTGLNITCVNPNEVGADRVATAIAASQMFPKENIIVIDFGTATTFCAITAKKNYLGGSILPGVRLSMEALASGTAKLSTVEILRAEHALGRTTVDSIQSGVFFGALGACKELIQRISYESFGKEPLRVLATGGFASLFEPENIYDLHLPDLVLQGLRFAMLMNHPLKA